MFITINNSETLYNALLIAQFKKDVENLTISYFLQNGTVLKEEFVDEASMNAKFDLVSNIKFGGGGSSNAVVVETDPTVPSYVKAISESNINQWNNSASKDDLNSYALKSELPEGYVASTSVTNVITLTQEEYNSLENKDDTVLYIIVG